ncbi:23S rRNA (pseudouridine(1915)-N(3))-methyltransferase RlmH [Anoxynatronum sibiricum]|uniref:Ribosomal RNA large subunit methyltransferase H n=1 Tax=Anoxynatronum sibiricum TaxID=210623 RepID=A0ABU9VRJ5_9CLOT
MQLTILSVGKIKEKYVKQGVDEYVKRLSRYCQLQLVEVPDEKAPENLSPAEEEQVKKREGEQLLKRMGDHQHVIALAIDGKQHSSEGLAHHLHQLGLTGKSNVVFVIGGSLGLAEAVLKRANESISFSLMTFPHQLMKVLLLEQVYRAFRINRNEPYHK